MKCERCKVESKGYSLHDYCATCSKNLCDRCMANGCCGSKPARSGMDLDRDESAEHQREAEDKAGIQ